MIMRDVNNGWIIRYTHANVASFFFIFVYMHIGRGLYYSSYKTPRVLVWSIGVIILVLMMAIGFLGYQYSPKWFSINIIIILFFICMVKLNNIKNKNIIIYKQLNLKKINKDLYPVSLRKYSTSSIVVNSIDISDRLKDIIKELDLNPVYIFENLNLENTRKQILNDTRGLSGIYMIVNKITTDYYIGSAATNKFYSRFSNHLIYFRGSKIVKLAVKKYNLENFAFIVLDLYPNIVTKENNKELMDLEDKYLKLLLPNYNILTEAGSSFGYKHSEIDRQKMKDIYTDTRREMIGSLNRGNKLLQETIEKIREKALNRLPMLEETKKKCITHTRPIIFYNLNGTIYGKYSTIIDAAKAINCNEKTIRRSLQTEKKIVKRQ